MREDNETLHTTDSAPVLFARSMAEARHILYVFLLATACRSERPPPKLPPPEYERPTVIPWQRYSDAVSEDADEMEPDASPSETTAVELE